MATANILVMIHGMTLDTTAHDHTLEYDALWEALTRAEPSIAAHMNDRIPIEWGHARPRNPGMPEPDQRLTSAENFIHDRISFDAVREDMSPNNHLLPPAAELFSQLVLRRLTTPLKERVLIFGITDTLYYCSADGERAVRDTVYSQVLGSLEPYRTTGEVRLHIIARSLGAAIAFDFLFGLFAPDTEFPNGQPGFVREQQSSSDATSAYSYWRERAQRGTLVLASKSSTAAQIPLLMLRKQKLVDMLAAEQLLDATVIGLRRTGPPHWKIFYDVDDVFGFPVRRIFDTDGSIQEYQVDTDWRPDTVHGRYWENDQVVDEMAQLIARNLGD